MPLVLSGILGQNARNLQYIKGGDFALAKRLADSKIVTKKFLARHNVAVPETKAILGKYNDLESFDYTSLIPPFVVKPSNGFGGKGILIFDEVDATGAFVTNSGQVYSTERLKEHFLYILDGFFSLSGNRDKIIIERKVVLDTDIKLLGKYGLPDLRIVSYNMVPVMAMIRIPTEESDGKANLHGGAAAAGIDLGTGKITYMFHRGKNVKTIPGIGDIRGTLLPEWEQVLTLTVKVQEVTGIRFLGCDIVLDDEKGPLLLEINARPGLEIQNVNLAPLRQRLNKVEDLSVGSVEKGVRLGRDLFSGDIEEKIKELSGKNIIGTREYVKLNYNEKTHTYIAQVRMSEDESILGESFARDILKIDTEGKTRVKIPTELLQTSKNISFKISPDTEENITLGKNSLRGYLVDPFKYKKGENPFGGDVFEEYEENSAITRTQEAQLLALDEKLMKIDKQLMLIKYVTPSNIAEQKQIFIEREGDYIPEFRYNETPFDVDKLLEELEKIEIPDIPFVSIYERKKNEVYNKLKFFQAFGEQNVDQMTLLSEKIFGAIDEEYFLTAKDIITQKEAISQEEEFLGPEDIEEYLKKFNSIYSISVKLKQNDISARFVMKGDTLVMRKDAKVGKREIRSIVAHEIEGHYLRKLSGKKSQFSMLGRGGARYIETDEGIAIHNQKRFLTTQDKKYYSIFERYYFLYYARKHSYRRLMNHLKEYYEDDLERVFTYMLRLKRGFKDPSKQGVFMKDSVYVNGYFSVEAYLRQGGTLEELYLGKLHVDDIIDLKESSVFTKHKNDIIIPFSA